MTVPKAVLLSVLVAAAVFSALGLAGWFQVGGIDAGSMVPGHAFAQSTTYETAPEFSSATLDRGTGVLLVTFDEVIDADSIDPAKFHVREQGYSTGGVTLSIAELDTDADSATVAFALNPANLATVNLLGTPELVIDPSAVSDLNGNMFVGTFDVTSASHAGNFSVGSYDDAPTGIAFSPDGTKMFVVGNANDSVYGYALSAPFDVTGTITHAGNFSVGSQDSNPAGIAFSPDGTKMFVVGDVSGSVYGYALSAPFDVTSTITPAGNFSVGSQDSSPAGIAFSPDGTKMFVVGDASGSVYGYALSDPFDVTSTITPAGNFSVGSQDSRPAGIAFSPDGTKMFVVGDVSDSVYGYALSAPFDVTSTITPAGNFSVGSQDSSPAGIAFSTDGAKMFVVGAQHKRVHEYALTSSPSFDIAVSGTPDATTSFVTTWRTSVVNQYVMFPGSGTYVIDWGDGNTPAQATGSTSHLYAAAGTYIVSVAGGLTQFNLGGPSSDGSNDIKIRSIEQWGNIEWTTMQDAFRGATSMVYNATDAPDLSGVTSMAGMFRDASSFNGDLSGWDTSEVTDMSAMFSSALIFNGDISGWDTSEVTDMNTMFSGSRFNGDISGWDTSEVTDMSAMFSGSTFNGDISGWDTSEVTDMELMFYTAFIFNGDISGWDVLKSHRHERHVQRRPYLQRRHLRLGRLKSHRHEHHVRRCLCL